MLILFLTYFSTLFAYKTNFGLGFSYAYKQVYKSKVFRDYTDEYVIIYLVKVDNHV